MHPSERIGGLEAEGHRPAPDTRAAQSAPRHAGEPHVPIPHNAAQKHRDQGVKESVIKNIMMSPFSKIPSRMDAEPYLTVSPAPIPLAPEDLRHIVQEPLFQRSAWARRADSFRIPEAQTLQIQPEGAIETSVPAPVLGLPPELADERVGSRGAHHSTDGLRSIRAEDPRSKGRSEIRHRRPPEEDGGQQLRTSG
eukprot:9038314-Alexandrium_andersonii.AAC.1